MPISAMQQSQEGLAELVSRIGDLSTSPSIFIRKESRSYDDKEEKSYLHVSLEFVDGKIKLVTSTEGYEALQAKFKNKRGDGTVINTEFRINLDDKQLYITGCYDSKVIMEDGNICLFTNSVGTLDGKEVYGDNEPEKMKELLNLSDKRYIEIKEFYDAEDTQPSPAIGASTTERHYISNPSKVGNGYY